MLIQKIVPAEDSYGKYENEVTAISVYLKCCKHRAIVNKLSEHDRMLDLTGFATQLLFLLRSLDISTQCVKGRASAPYGLARLRGRNFCTSVSGSGGNTWVSLNKCLGVSEPRRVLVWPRWL